jgi:ceramide glucosyltransferase
VRLTDAPFGQPLGRRSMMEVWRRQTRWARLRRACFPLFFVPEIFGGALLPLITAGYVAHASGVPVAAAVAALTAAWYGAETALVKTVGWHLTPLYPVHAMLRDLLLPALWIDAWVGTDFVWRGNQMSIATDAPSA